MFDKKRSKSAYNKQIPSAQVQLEHKYEYQRATDNQFDAMNPFSIENVPNTTGVEYPKAKHDLDDIYSEIKNWKDEEARAREAAERSVQVNNNQNTISCCTIL